MGPRWSPRARPSAGPAGACRSTPTGRGSAEPAGWPGGWPSRCRDLSSGSCSSGWPGAARPESWRRAGPASAPRSGWGWGCSSASPPGHHRPGNRGRDPARPGAPGRPAAHLCPLATAPPPRSWAAPCSADPLPVSWFLAFLAGWGILRIVALVPVLGGLVWFAAVGSAWAHSPSLSGGSGPRAVPLPQPPD